jgi:hypothetical protein
MNTCSIRDNAEQKILNRLEFFHSMKKNKRRNLIVGVVGCMAHARRKFHELHVTKKSQVAEQALVLIQKLYAIEAELRKKTDGTAEDRREYRQQHSQPVMQQLYEWLNQHHLTVPSSSPTAKAINYTLKRWPALSRYLDDGNLPIDDNCFSYSPSSSISIQQTESSNSLHLQISEFFRFNPITFILSAIRFPAI